VGTKGYNEGGTAPVGRAGSRARPRNLENGNGRKVPQRKGRRLTFGSRAWHDRCVDTAEIYADGDAEEIVGEAVAGRPDEVFLVSKVYPPNIHVVELRRSIRSLIPPALRPLLPRSVKAVFNSVLRRSSSTAPKNSAEMHTHAPKHRRRLRAKPPTAQNRLPRPLPPALARRGTARRDAHGIWRSHTSVHHSCRSCMPKLLIPKWRILPAWHL
jgi:hypothetical protein